MNHSIKLPKEVETMINDEALALAWKAYDEATAQAGKKEEQNG